MTKSKTLPPLGHRLVLTDDGSYTLYSEHFDENCHSTAGAHGETINYFINESGLRESAESGPQEVISIFETGFGLGMNFLESYRLFKNLCLKGKLHYISSEIDENLILWFQKQNSFFSKMKKSGSSYLYEDEFAKLEILLGDARKELPQWLDAHPSHLFQFIFQDAFSPKKNPSLWEKEWFELLKAKTTKKSSLITYSASHSVRQNLELAGWKTINIPGFGHKRSATKAYPM